MTQNPIVAIVSRVARTNAHTLVKGIVEVRAGSIYTTREMAAANTHHTPTTVDPSWTCNDREGNRN